MRATWVSSGPGPAAIFATAVLILGAGVPRNASAQVAGLALRGLQAGGARAGDALPDAFRSPFDDKDSWWSAARRLDTGETRLDYTKDEPVTRRLTGDEGYAHDRRLEWEFAGPLRPAPGRWWGALAYENQDLRTDFSGKKTATTLRARGELVTGALRYHVPGPGMTIQVTAPLWHEGNLDRRTAGAGVRCEPGELLALQVARTHTRSDVQFKAVIMDEPVPFGANLFEDAWHVDLRLQPWPILVVEGSWREGEYGALEPVSSAEVYEFMPDGWSRLRSATLRSEPWHRHEFLLRFQELVFDLDAEAFWGGQRFGILNYARGNQRSWLVGWRWQVKPATRVRIELEELRLDAVARLRVESWPFTETVIDLLGVRQVVKGTISANWYRLTGSVDYGFLGGRWRTGVSWLRAWPEGVLESWRYAFLVFGRADYKRDDLRIQRADLVSLLLEGSVPAGLFALHLSLQQFVYGASRESSAGGGEAPAPGAPDHVVNGWWGGTYLKVGVSVGFG